MNTRNINLLPKVESAFEQKNWNELLNLLDPKLFRTLELGELVAFPILAKVAQIFTAEDIAPNIVKIACLKCLGNSCFNSYIHKEYISTNIERGTYCYKLYSNLANIENLKQIKVSNSYPLDSHFPYEGIIEWTSNFITSCEVNNDLSDDKLEILRLSIQFLCNLFSFAYKDSNFPDQHNVPQYLNDTDLKNIIINMVHSEHMPLVRASCVFIHNALKEFERETFTEIEQKHLCSQLLKPIKKGFESAKEALMLLLCHTNVLQNVYNDMIIENKLCLLQIIYNELSDTVSEAKEEYVFTKSTIEFLIETFCTRSDLILKTADTYLDEIEPTEVVILLDILGTLTSGSCKEYSSLESYTTLLVTCTYLLKYMETIGKQSNNYFTPLQKLSDIASVVQSVTENESTEHSNGIETKEKERSNLHRHPAFGFKAGLIRIIGNMSYRNKKRQDLLREMDAIPLLLDCCNIDARNPLIMQWAILALRNLCEGNATNQDTIRNCTRIGIVESSVLQEIGVTLHEDEQGKRIGIVPLPRE